MDNKTKQYISGLEARIMRLEAMFEAINIGMDAAYQSAYSCSQCGAFDPANGGYVCATPDCCQGLNPEDDDNKGD